MDHGWVEDADCRLPPQLLRVWAVCIGAMRRDITAGYADADAAAGIRMDRGSFEVGRLLRYACRTRAEPRPSGRPPFPVPKPHTLFNTRTLSLVGSSATRRRATDPDRLWLIQQYYSLSAAAQPDNWCTSACSSGCDALQFYNAKPSLTSFYDAGKGGLVLRAMRSTATAGFA